MKRTLALLQIVLLLVSVLPVGATHIEGAEHPWNAQTINEALGQTPPNLPWTDPQVQAAVKQVTDQATINKILDAIPADQMSLLTVDQLKTAGPKLGTLPPDKKAGLTDVQLADATVLTNVGNLRELNVAALNGGLNKLYGSTTLQLTFDASLGANSAVVFDNGVLRNSAFCKEGACGLNIAELAGAAKSRGLPVLVTATGDSAEGKALNGFTVCIVQSGGTSCSNILGEDGVLKSISAPGQGTLVSGVGLDGQLKVLEGGVTAVRDANGQIHWLIVDGSNVEYMGMRYTARDKKGNIDLTFTSTTLQIRGPVSYESLVKLPDGTPSIRGFTTKDPQGNPPYMDVSYAADGQPVKIDVRGMGEMLVSTAVNGGHLDKRILNNAEVTFGRKGTVPAVSEVLLKDGSSLYQQEQAIDEFARAKIDKDYRITTIKPTVDEHGDPQQNLRIHVEDGIGTFLDARAAALSELLRIQQGESTYKAERLEELKNGKTKFEFYSFDGKDFQRETIEITNQKALEDAFNEHYPSEKRNALLRDLNPANEAQVYLGNELNLGDARNPGNIVLRNTATSGLVDIVTPTQHIITQQASALAFFRDTPGVGAKQQLYVRSSDPKINGDLATFEHFSGGRTTAGLISATQGTIKASLTAASIVPGAAGGVELRVFFDKEGAGPNVVVINKDSSDLLLAGKTGQFGEQWDLAKKPIPAANLENLRRSVETERIVATKGFEGLVTEIRRLYGPEAEAEFKRRGIEVSKDGAISYGGKAVGEGIGGLVTNEALGTGAPAQTTTVGLLLKVADDAKLGNVKTLVEAARAEVSNDRTRAIQLYNEYIAGGGNKVYAANQIYGQYRAEAADLAATKGDEVAAAKKAEGLAVLQSLAADPKLSPYEKASLAALIGSAQADTKNYAGVDQTIASLQALRNTPGATPEFQKFIDEKIAGVSDARMSAQRKDALGLPTSSGYLERAQQYAQTLPEAQRNAFLAQAYLDVAQVQTTTTDQRSKYLDKAFELSTANGGQASPTLLNALGDLYKQQGRDYDAYIKRAQAKERAGDIAANQNYDSTKGFSFADFFKEQNTYTERQFYDLASLQQKAFTPENERQIAVIASTYLSTTLKPPKEDLGIMVRGAQAYTNIRDFKASTGLATQAIDTAKAAADAAIAAGKPEEAKPYQQQLLQALVIRSANQRAEGGVDSYANERADLKSARDVAQQLNDPQNLAAIKARLDASYIAEADYLKRDDRVDAARSLLVNAARDGNDAGLVREMRTMISEGENLASVSSLLTQSGLAGSNRGDIVQIENIIELQTMATLRDQYTAAVRANDASAAADVLQKLNDARASLEERTASADADDTLRKSLDEQRKNALLIAADASITGRDARTLGTLRTELSALGADAATLKRIDEARAQFTLQEAFASGKPDFNKLEHLVEDLGLKDTDAAKYAKGLISVHARQGEFAAALPDRDETSKGKQPNFEKLKAVVANIDKDLLSSDLNDNQRLQLYTMRYQAQTRLNDVPNAARAATASAALLDKLSLDAKANGRTEDAAAYISAYLQMSEAAQQLNVRAAAQLLKNGDYQGAKEFQPFASGYLDAMQKIKQGDLEGLRSIDTSSADFKEGARILASNIQFIDPSKKEFAQGILARAEGLQSFAAWQQDPSKITDPATRQRFEGALQLENTLRDLNQRLATSTNIDDQRSLRAGIQLANARFGAALSGTPTTTESSEIHSLELATSYLNERAAASNKAAVDAKYFRNAAELATSASIDAKLLAIDRIVMPNINNLVGTTFQNGESFAAIYNSLQDARNAPLGADDRKRIEANFAQIQTEVNNRLQNSLGGTPDDVAMALRFAARIKPEDNYALLVHQSLLDPGRNTMLSTRESAAQVRNSYNEKAQLAESDGLAKAVFLQSTANRVALNTLTQNLFVAQEYASFVTHTPLASGDRQLEGLNAVMDAGEKLQGQFYVQEKVTGVKGPGIIVTLGRNEFLSTLSAAPTEVRKEFQKYNDNLAAAQLSVYSKGVRDAADGVGLWEGGAYDSNKDAYDSAGKSFTLGVALSMQDPATINPATRARLLMELENLGSAEKQYQTKAADTVASSVGRVWDTFSDGARKATGYDSTTQTLSTVQRDIERGNYGTAAVDAFTGNFNVQYDRAAGVLKSTVSTLLSAGGEVVGQGAHHTWRGIKGMGNSVVSAYEYYTGAPVTQAPNEARSTAERNQAAYNFLLNQIEAGNDGTSRVNSIYGIAQRSDNELKALYGMSDQQISALRSVVKDANDGKTAWLTEAAAGEQREKYASLIAVEKARVEALQQLEAKNAWRENTREFSINIFAWPEKIGLFGRDLTTAVFGGDDEYSGLLRSARDSQQDVRQLGELRAQLLENPGTSIVGIVNSNPALAKAFSDGRLESLQDAYLSERFGAGWQDNKLATATKASWAASATQNHLAFGDFEGAASLSQKTGSTSFINDISRLKTDYENGKVMVDTASILAGTYLAAPIAAISQRAFTAVGTRVGLLFETQAFKAVATFTAERLPTFVRAGGAASEGVGLVSRAIEFIAPERASVNVRDVLGKGGLNEPLSNIFQSARGALSIHETFFDPANIVGSFAQEAFGDNSLAGQFAESIAEGLGGAKHGVQTGRIQAQTTQQAKSALQQFIGTTSGQSVAIGGTTIDVATADARTLADTMKQAGVGAITLPNGKSVTLSDLERIQQHATHQATYNVLSADADTPATALELARLDIQLDNARDMYLAASPAQQVALENTILELQAAKAETQAAQVRAFLTTVDADEGATKAYESMALGAEAEALANKEALARNAYSAAVASGDSAAITSAGSAYSGAAAARAQATANARGAEAAAWESLATTSRAATAPSFTDRLKSFFGIQPAANTNYADALRAERQQNDAAYQSALAAQEARIHREQPTLSTTLSTLDAAILRASETHRITLQRLATTDDSDPQQQALRTAELNTRFGLLSLQQQHLDIIETAAIRSGNEQLNTDVESATTENAPQSLATLLSTAVQTQTIREERASRQSETAATETQRDIIAGEVRQSQTALQNVHAAVAAALASPSETSLERVRQAVATFSSIGISSAANVVASTDAVTTAQPTAEVSVAATDIREALLATNSRINELSAERELLLEEQRRCAGTAVPTAAAVVDITGLATACPNVGPRLQLLARQVEALRPLATRLTPANVEAAIDAPTNAQAVQLIVTLAGARNVIGSDALNRELTVEEQLANAKLLNEIEDVELYLRLGRDAHNGIIVVASETSVILTSKVINAADIKGLPPSIQQALVTGAPLSLEYAALTLAKLPSASFATTVRIIKALNNVVAREFAGATRAINYNVQISNQLRTQLGRAPTTQEILEEAAAMVRQRGGPSIDPLPTMIGGDFQQAVERQLQFALAELIQMDLQTAGIARDAVVQVRYVDIDGTLKTVQGSVTSVGQDGIRIGTGPTLLAGDIRYFKLITPATPPAPARPTPAPALPTRVSPITVKAAAFAAYQPTSSERAAVDSLTAQLLSAEDLIQDELNAKAAEQQVIFSPGLIHVAYENGVITDATLNEPSTSSVRVLTNQFTRQITSIEAPADVPPDVLRKVVAAAAQYNTERAPTPPTAPTTTPPPSAQTTQSIANAAIGVAKGAALGLVPGAGAATFLYNAVRDHGIPLSYADRIALAMHRTAEGIPLVQRVPRLLFGQRLADIEARLITAQIGVREPTITTEPTPVQPTQPTPAQPSAPAAPSQVAARFSQYTFANAPPGTSSALSNDFLRVTDTPTGATFETFRFVSYDGESVMFRVFDDDIDISRYELINVLQNGDRVVRVSRQEANGWINAYEAAQAQRQSAEQQMSRVLPVLDAQDAWTHGTPLDGLLAILEEGKIRPGVEPEEDNLPVLYFDDGTTAEFASIGLKPYEYSVAFAVKGTNDARLLGTAIPGALFVFDPAHIPANTENAPGKELRRLIGDGITDGVPLSSPFVRNIIVTEDTYRLIEDIFSRASPERLNALFGGRDWRSIIVTTTTYTTAVPSEDVSAALPAFTSVDSFIAAANQQLPPGLRIINVNTAADGSVALEVNVELTQPDGKTRTQNGNVVLETPANGEQITREVILGAQRVTRGESYVFRRTANGISVELSPTTGPNQVLAALNDEVLVQSAKASPTPQTIPVVIAGTTAQVRIDEVAAQFNEVAAGKKIDHETSWSLERAARIWLRPSTPTGTTPIENARLERSVQSVLEKTLGDHVKRADKRAQLQQVFGTITVDDILATTESRLDPDALRIAKQQYGVDIAHWLEQQSALGGGDTVVVRLVKNERGQDILSIDFNDASGHGLEGGVLNAYYARFGEQALLKVALGLDATQNAQLRTRIADPTTATPAQLESALTAVLGRDVLVERQIAAVRDAAKQFFPSKFLSGVHLDINLATQTLTNHGYGYEIGVVREQPDGSRTYDAVAADRGRVLGLVPLDVPAVAIPLRDVKAIVLRNDGITESHLLANEKGGAVESFDVRLTTILAQGRLPTAQELVDLAQRTVNDANLALGIVTTEQIKPNTDDMSAVMIRTEWSKPAAGPEQKLSAVDEARQKIDVLREQLRQARQARGALDGFLQRPDSTGCAVCDTDARTQLMARVQSSLDAIAVGDAAPLPAAEILTRVTQRESELQVEQRNAQATLDALIVSQPSQTDTFRQGITSAAIEKLVPVGKRLPPALDALVHDTTLSQQAKEQRLAAVTATLTADALTKEQGEPLGGARDALRRAALLITPNNPARTGELLSDIDFHMINEVRKSKKFDLEGKIDIYDTGSPTKSLISDTDVFIVQREGIWTDVDANAVLAMARYLSSAGLTLETTPSVAISAGHTTSTERLDVAVKASLVADGKTGESLRHKMLFARNIDPSGPSFRSVQQRILDDPNVYALERQSFEFRFQGTKLAAIIANEGVPRTIDEVRERAQHVRLLGAFDVKKDLGGTRTIQQIQWMLNAKLDGDLTSPQGVAKLYVDAIAAGLLTPREAKALQDADAFWRIIRNTNHLRTNKEFDSYNTLIGDDVLAPLSTLKGTDVRRLAVEHVQNVVRIGLRVWAEVPPSPDVSVLDPLPTSRQAVQRTNEFITNVNRVLPRENKVSVIEQRGTNAVLSTERGTITLTPSLSTADLGDDFVATLVTSLGTTSVVVTFEPSVLGSRFLARLFGRQPTAIASIDLETVGEAQYAPVEVLIEDAAHAAARAAAEPDTLQAGALVQDVSVPDPAVTLNHDTLETATRSALENIMGTRVTLGETDFGSDTVAVTALIVPFAPRELPAGLIGSANIAAWVSSELDEFDFAQQLKDLLPSVEGFDIQVQPPLRAGDTYKVIIRASEQPNVFTAVETGREGVTA